MKPIGCTWLNQSKGSTIGCHENVVFQIEMNQLIQGFEAINLFSTTFPIEKPLAIEVFDFNVGDLLRSFDADHIVTWHCLRIPDEKEADLIA